MSRTTVRYAPSSLAVARPDLIGRLVHSIDKALRIDSPRSVTIWCDGKVSAQRPHPRREYRVTIADLQSEANRCPDCAAAPRSTRRINTEPKLMARLLDRRQDSRLHMDSAKPVRIWCDGAVRRKPRHEPVAYLATPDQLTRSSPKDPCPLCAAPKTS